MWCTRLSLRPFAVVKERTDNSLPATEAASARFVNVSQNLPNFLLSSRKSCASCLLLNTHEALGRGSEQVLSTVLVHQVEVERRRSPLATGHPPAVRSRHLTLVAFPTLMPD